MSTKAPVTMTPEMQKFLDYFQHRCEGLYMHFGIEAVELYNAAVLATPADQPSAKEPPKPVAWYSPKTEQYSAFGAGRPFAKAFSVPLYAAPLLKE